MGKADAAIFIDHAHERHASELEEVNLLTIRHCHMMFGIGETDERKFFLRPVLLKCGFSIRANGKDLCAAAFEFFVLITHARQRRAAIGSGEAAQEGEHKRLLPTKIGKADAVTVEIIDFKFGGKFARGEQIGFHCLYGGLDTLSLPDHRLQILNHIEHECVGTFLVREVSALREQDELRAGDLLRDGFEIPRANQLIVFATDDERRRF